MANNGREQRVVVSYLTLRRVVGVLREPGGELDSKHCYYLYCLRSGAVNPAS